MNNEIQRFIAQVCEGRHLSRMEAGRAFQIIMSGGATPAQMAALLVALRMKGESVGEITGAAEALRAKMDDVQPSCEVMDVCGTGGDGKGMLNVSTAVAIVVAACGVKVAKHGNRSVSSRSGSADVLVALGVNIQAGKQAALVSLAESGMCFLFAPHYHRAMRHVAPVRQELAIRTIFNLVGPLVNPARPAIQLMGVYDPSLVVPMAEVLQALGSRRAWVVCGHNGEDEVSLTGASHVAELMEGAITTRTITPQEAGLTTADADALTGGSAEHNAKELTLLLAGRLSPYRDMVLLNAAAALVVAERTRDLREGVSIAADAIDSGKAKAVLATLVKVTNEAGMHE